MNALNIHPLSHDPFHAAMRAVGVPIGFRRRFDPDAEDNLEAHIAASAPSTLYGFRTDIARWIAHCQEHNIDALCPKARDVRDFIKAFEIGRLPSTVKRMVANISVLTSAIMGNKNVCHSKVVKSEMKRLRRERGGQHKQALAIRMLGDVASMDDPAEPFSTEMMLKALEPDRSLRGLRGKLLISLGADTGRRNMEYRDANFRHLASGPGGTGRFHVDRSKTDQDGNGIVRFVSRRTMRYRDEWIAARLAAGEDITFDSPLLIGLDQHGNPGTRLTASGYHIAMRWSVRKALTLISADYPDLASQIDYIVEHISGHSFRVGMVQDLITAGEPMAVICIEGGWETSTMPLLYGRNIDVKNGGCARLRGKLGDE